MIWQAAIKSFLRAPIQNYTYDAQTGLLTNQTVKLGTTSLVDLSYGYNDANGKKTGQLLTLTDSKNSHRSRAFSYDKLGRVSQVSGTSSGGAWQQAYSYDRYGNRLSVARTGVGASVVPLDAIDTGNQNSNTLTYASGANQPVSNRITTTGYTYDAAGNLTKGEAPDGSWQRYQYDSVGRLSKVINDANSQELASYSYGVSNERLIASDNGGAVVTYYAWDGGQVIAEYTQSGISLVFQKSYVYLGGRLLATEKSDQSKQYHHPDRLGTRMVTDGSGTPISENVVLPFGTMLAAGTTLYGDNSYQSTTQSNPSKRFFTSYDRSQTTKLDYAVNRHYNAGQGRFTQVDPIGMSAVNLEDPQTLNLYAYCGNDPINRIDPDGLSFFGWLGKAFKFLFKVATVVLVVLAVLVAPLSLGASLIFLGVAGLTGLAGWDNGKLGQIAATVLSLGFGSGSYGSLRTPSTFPNGTGVSGVSNFLAQKKGGYNAERVAKSAAQLASFVLRNMFSGESLFSKENRSGLDYRIIFCQAARESGFNSRAIGGDGEIGLLQVKLSTANGVGLGKFDKNSLYNAETNIRVGSTYLGQLAERFGSARNGLIAYNWGRGNAARKGLDAAPVSALEYADGILGCARLLGYDPPLFRLEQFLRGPGSPFSIK